MTKRRLSPRGQVRKLREAAKLQTSEILRLRSELVNLQQEQRVREREDKLLPQKQMVLKELSEMVAAVSHAVRTSMWSIRVPKQGEW